VAAGPTESCQLPIAAGRVPSVSRAQLDAGPQGLMFLEAAVVWWCGVPAASQEAAELTTVLAAFGGAR
jgi:hypothetical protein